MPSLATAAPVARPLHRFAVRGVRSIGVGIALAGLLAAVYQRAFVPTLIYSVCISVCCWFFTSWRL